MYPFQLLRPDGREVRLASAKVEALLAMLASRRPDPALRSDIELALWPDSSLACRQVNLRQAIYRLRGAIGRATVVTGRTTCLLSDDFTLIVQPSILSVATGAGSPMPGPLDSFMTVLAWCASRDPGQMFDMMRSNLDLTIGLEPKMLCDLLDLALAAPNQCNVMPEWVDFWRGFCHYCGHEIRKAQPLFLKSLQRALETRDPILVVEASFWLANAYQFLLRPDLSEKVVDFVQGYVTSLRKPVYNSKLDLLKGLGLMHSGNIALGMESLSRAGEAYDGRELDRAQHEAMLAMFRAAAGETSKASQLLEWPNKVALESEHYRLTAICEMARGLIALTERQNTLAISIMSRLSDSAVRAKAVHMEIYGRESAAVALWRSGDRSMAVEQLRASKSLRGKIKMGYTAWDRARLQAALPASLTA